MLHVFVFFVLLFALCSYTFYKQDQLTNTEVFGINILMLVVLVVWWHVKYFWFVEVGVNFAYTIKVWLFALIVGSICGTFCHFRAINQAEKRS